MTQGPNARNGLFFRGDRYSPTYLRLQFDLANGVDHLLNWLKSRNVLPLGNITTKDCSFACIKYATSELILCSRTSKVSDTLAWSGLILFNGGTDNDIKFWLTFKPGDTSLVLQFPNWSGVSVDDIFSWLRTTLDFGSSADNKASMLHDKV